MQYFLGIDVGGSKAEVAIFRIDGTLISTGRYDNGLSLADEPRDTPFRVGAGRGIHSIHKALELAFITADFPEDEVVDLTITMHMGSFPIPLLAGINLGAITVKYATEFSPVFELAGVKYAAFSLAGTGASTFCVLPDGRSMSMDGAGPDLGDLGGGCYIGKRALTAVLKSIWHERYDTSLKEAIPKALGFKQLAPKEINHYEELVQYSLRPHDRAYIAGIARIVAEEAAKGDRVATELLIDASDQLSETLSLVVDRLNCTDMELPLITMGSLLAKSDIYWDNFISRVKDFAPNFIPMRTVISPSVGNALSGMRKICPKEYNDFLREKVLENSKDMIFTTEAPIERREAFYERRRHHYYD